MDSSSPSSSAVASPATKSAEALTAKVDSSKTSTTLGGSIESIFRLIERGHRALLDSLPQAVFFKNKDSVLVYVNAALATAMGRKKEEVVGKTDFDFHSRDLAEKYRTDDQRIMAQRKPEQIEEYFVGADGKRRIIETLKTPILDEKGDAIGIMGIINDITDRKKVIADKRRSEEELRRVWDESFDGMRLTDEDGIITRVNPAFCRMVRKPMDELVGKPFTVIYESDYPQNILAKHKRRFIERSVERVFERELHLWNGEKVWFELSNSFLDIEGHRPRLLSIFRDVSERKNAEETLTEFNNRLERSNRELQDFAYVASHDLQEPLRKIGVFADRLKAKYSDNLGEEGRDYVDRMQKAAVRMQALINDLLCFSRVTTKSQPFVQVDLNKVMREVLLDLETRIEQTGGTVDVGPLPTIEAEPLHMRQLLQNLVGNALKFHKPKEKPYIRVDAFLFKEPPTGRSEPREMMQLTVSDNGIGFDEKYLDRIFQVFQRLHSRSEYEGTGMGLAITRKIVEHHKGQITAKSKPGEGATFIVILPVEQLKPDHIA